MTSPDPAWRRLLARHDDPSLDRALRAARRGDRVLERALGTPVGRSALIGRAPIDALGAAASDEPHDVLALWLARAVASVAGARPADLETARSWELGLTELGAELPEPWHALCSQAAADVAERHSTPDDHGRDPTIDAPHTAGLAGNYLLQEEIGRGAAGTVYRAVHETTRRPAAVKVLHARRVSDDSLRRFELEARVLARLEHPGIARVFEASAEIGTETGCFLAMELVDGVSIAEFARGRPLDEQLALMANVCDAVQHAHDRGVIHRDLKPSNILVDREGRPKVLDFGVARPTVDALRATWTLTADGSVVGTPAYMSPEQARGRHDLVDTRSDVYALGVILFEFVTGSLPHRVAGLSLLDALQVVGRGASASARSLCPGVPPEIDAVLAKCLVLESEQRYASPRELASELRSFLNGDGVQVRPLNARRQVVRFVKRHRLATAVTSFVAVTVLGSLTLALLARSRQARTRENVTEFAQSLIGVVGRTLESSGASAADEATLRDVLDGIDEASRDDPDDPGLHEARADTLELLGDLEVRRADFSAAHACFQQALEIREAAVARDPDDIDAAAAHSIGLVKIGDTLRGLQRLAEAEAVWDQALAIDEKLARQRPEDATLLGNLGYSYERKAWARQQVRDADAAVAWTERRLSAAQAVVELDDSPARRFGLARAHGRMFELRRYRARREDVQAHAEEAVRLARELVAEYPGSRRYLLLLRECCSQRAAFHWEFGERGVAVRDELAALDAAESALAVDPSDACARRQSVLVLLRLAVWHAQLGDVDAARAFHDRGLAEVDHQMKSGTVSPTTLTAAAGSIARFADEFEARGISSTEYRTAQCALARAASRCRVEIPSVGVHLAGLLVNDASTRADLELAAELLREWYDPDDPQLASWGPTISRIREAFARHGLAASGKLR